MITEAILNFLIHTVALIVTGIPDSSPEFQQQVDDAAAGIGSVLHAVAAWGFLIPFPEIGFAVIALFVAVQVAIVIRFVRIAASFLTLGGGM